VCVAAGRMTMEAFDWVVFRQLVNRTDLVMPDGRPLVWALRSLGIRGAFHVRGTDLKTHVVERVGRENVPIGMYGGTP
jgi:N-acetylglucosaminyldiphosphoundecaprenol N-acetyl-beta-D-mannosaminyltransferase